MKDPAHKAQKAQYQRALNNSLNIIHKGIHHSTEPAPSHHQGVPSPTIKRPHPTPLDVVSVHLATNFFLGICLGLRC